MKAGPSASQRTVMRACWGASSWSVQFGSAMVIVCMSSPRDGVSSTCQHESAPDPDQERLRPFRTAFVCLKRAEVRSWPSSRVHRDVSAA